MRDRMNLGLVLVLIAATIACAAPPPVGPPTLEEIQSLTCAGILDTPVRLTRGAWEGEPRIRISLVEGVYLPGDLAAGSDQEAAVLLFESAGGSGGFTHLAVVGRQEGRALCLAVAPLGDRVQVRSAQLEGREIRLSVIQHDADDAMCCPSQKATRAWVLEQGRLVERPAHVEGPFTLADLQGQIWVLKRWTWAEPAPEQPEITLEFTAGGIAGSSGCNRYTGTLTMGGHPGDLTSGAIAVTRMACAEPAMAAEKRYLDALGAVTNLSFQAASLALTWQRDSTIDSMMFELKAGPALPRRP